mgnify:FL=1
MKTNNIKQKVAAKAAKVKGTVARKCGKVCKALIAAFALATLFGCATAEQPISNPSLQAGKSQTQHVTMHQSQVNIFLGVKEATVGPTNEVKLTGSERAELPDISVLAQAQALESSGTETYSPSNTPNNVPTATPSNKVDTKLDAKYNDATKQAAGALESILAMLTPESQEAVKSLAASGKNGSVEVTRTDGTKASVVCESGNCSLCTDGSCSPQ